MAALKYKKYDPDPETDMFQPNEIDLIIKKLQDQVAELEQRINNLELIASWEAHHE